MSESTTFAEELIAASAAKGSLCWAVSVVACTQRIRVRLHEEIQPEQNLCGAKIANARLYNKTEECDRDTGRAARNEK